MFLVVSPIPQVILLYSYIVCDWSTDKIHTSLFFYGSLPLSLVFKDSHVIPFFEVSDFLSAFLFFVKSQFFLSLTAILFTVSDFIVQPCLPRQIIAGSQCLMKFFVHLLHRRIFVPHTALEG